jgi:hypothetical protein
MNRYRITLKDGRYAFVNAVECRKENNKHVFYDEHGAEIAFFNVADVSGVHKLPQ